MASPLKPWESGSIGSSRNTLLPTSRTGIGSVAPSARNMPIPGSAEVAKDPPQAPPRPNAQRMGYRGQISPSLGGLGYGNQNSYGMMGSPYSMYGGGGGMYGGGGGMYGGSMYGGSMYGGAGYRSCSPYNQMGYGGNGDVAAGSFVRRAEESSRPAFESIQSLVQAFGSIAMMMESTFFAVHSSFRAVLGVADQFSLTKQNMINTLGALTIFKTIRYIFRKLLLLLRLRKPMSTEDELWGEAKDVMAKSNVKATRSWPIVMFFAVVLGTPWLIWKLLQSVGEDSSEITADTWLNGHGEHFAAQAQFHFEAENEDELSFQEGDILRIAPKGKQPSVRGWLLATVDGKQEGIVPANHVNILGRRSGNPRKVETISEEN